MTFEVRRATDDELERTVRFRWLWTLESGETPEMSEPDNVRDAAAWARDHAATHIPHIAIDGVEFLGMACLAITPWIPATRSIHRRSGDPQSCYVLPHYRDRGIGARLVAAVLETASSLGLEHVTVHASPQISAYVRPQRFQNDRKLAMGRYSGVAL